MTPMAIAKRRWGNKKTGKKIKKLIPDNQGDHIEINIESQGFITITTPGYGSGIGFIDDDFYTKYDPDVFEKICRWYLGIE